MMAYNNHFTRFRNHPRQKPSLFRRSRKLIIIVAIIGALIAGQKFKVYNLSDLSLLPQRLTKWAQGSETTKQSSAFLCAGKMYCGQMESCEEAYFYMRSCGLSRLDGDNDGMPCESICR
jgi:hypothetical protein